MDVSGKKKTTTLKIENKKTASQQNVFKRLERDSAARHDISKIMDFFWLRDVNISLNIRAAIILSAI